MTRRSVQFASFTLDLDRLCLHGPSGQADLRPKSFEVLRYLVEHAGRVVGKEEVIKAVWPDVIVTDESLTVCVSEVRRALGDKNQQIVKTVPKRGYLLDVPISTGDVAVTRAPQVLMATVALKSVSPADQVLNHTAETIDRDVPADERKQVTVLCADFKESLEFIAERDPEKALKILDAALRLMRQAVHRYEGTVTLVTGDGIVALFGVPLTHEDHAVRACYAALKIRESVERYSRGLQYVPAVPILIRAGLNSGEVVTHSIASDVHTEYRAMGQTTHLAARLGEIAAPGTLLVSAGTLRLAEGHVQVRAVEPSNNAGLREPVYELIGAGPAQTRFQALAARGLTRFVGRAAELEQLNRAKELAGSGRGQAAAVVGEAGVGKSRLVYEFTHSHHLQGWLILDTASVSYGKATSYLPVIDLLKGYFKIQDWDHPREIREKVMGKLLNLDEALNPTLPALLALLDVAVDDPGWEALDPGQRRQRTLDAVRQLFLREAQEQPLLLIFEDLHWIDSETQAVLDRLIESLPAARFLLLVNYRPEYQHAWGGRTYYLQIRIDPLQPDGADALLNTLLGEDPALEPLKRMLIARTEGNPFFLEESVRALVETKALEGERGRYQLTRPLQSLQVPPTVQVILASRIDRLPVNDKQLLQVASVIGEEVPFGLLQAVTELSDEALRQGLANLQIGEFMYETQLFPELEYTFRHALTQEVTYKSLPLEARRGHHERIARALEASFAGRLDERSELLGHHYQQAGNIEKALEYLLRAAHRATSRFASVEALGYSAAVIECLDGLPKTDERERQRIDLRLAEVEMIWVQGRYEQGLRILEETQAIAERLRDDERLAQIHFRTGWLLYDQLELDRAFEHQQECFRLCQRLGCLESMRRVYWGLGHSCRALSEDIAERRAKAIEFHHAGLRLGEAAESAEFFDVHNAHFLWLIYLFQLGDWTTAMGYLERAEAMARRLPEMLHVALMMGSRGLSRLLKQKSAGDLELLRASLAAAEQAGSHIYRTISRYFLGQWHFLVGEFAEAVGHFEAALAISGQTRRGNLFQPGLLLWMAEAEARLGLHDAALAHLCRYNQLIQRVGAIEGLAWFPSRGVAHRIRGLLLTKQKALTDASEQFARSLELLAAHGYKPDLARTYIVVGECEQQRGRLLEARHAFETGATCFRKMGFTFELQQTLRLLEGT